MAYLAKNQEDDQYGSPSQALQQQASQSVGSGQGLDKQNGTGVDQSAAGQNGAGTSTKAPGEFTKSNFTNATAIIDRNKNADTTSAATGRLVGDVAQQASGQVADVQGRAKTYDANQRDKISSTYASPNADMLNRALGGDANADSTIQGFARKTGADAVENFNAGTRQELAPQEFFQQNEFAPLLQQRSGTGYTSGMAALDSTFLNRGNAGQQIKNQVSGYQKTVDDARNEAAGVQGRVQKFADDYFGNQKGSFNNVLTSKRGEFDAGFAPRLTAAQKAKDDAIASQKAAAKASLQNQIRNKANSQTFTDFDPNIAQMKNTKDILQGISDADLEKYIAVNNPTLTEADTINKDEAGQYNKLLEYLGTSEGRKQAAASPAKYGASAKSDDFEAYLNSLVSSNTGRNNSIKATVEAQKKAQQEETLRQAVARKALAGNQGVAGPNPTGQKEAPKNETIVDKAKDTVVKAFKKATSIFG